VVPLTEPLGGDNNTGKGDVPSPTMAMELQEAIGAAPVIAQRTPANVSTASKAVSSFFICATLRVSDLSFTTPGLMNVVAKLKNI